ncbi:hypothetical protein ACFXNW_24845 [Nocardia sp. NPDC059180]|uniref:hypothetical protein n=1 Tax=Nocardia sp. NPDC059180 TaxID=3346761 RepID=UPI00368F25D7
MWEWGRSVAEHATAAAFTQPVTEPEPKYTEAEFTVEAPEGEAEDARRMWRAARPSEFDLAG